MISVIVLAYNIKAFLEECLDSILNQTFQDLEIIIVDDCSTDGTSALCDTLAHKDSRIRVIHLPENKGVSNARNVGIKASHGDYVYMIDGDDFIHPQMLEVLLYLLDGTEYDFSMVRGIKVPSDAGLDFFDGQNHNNYSSKRELNQRELMYYLWGFGNLQYVVVWNKLYRREQIEDVESLPTASQDSNWNIRVAMKVRKVIILDEVMYAWRQHDASITHQGVNFRLIDRINSYLLSYRAVEKSKPEYKSYALDGLYREIFYTKFHARGTAFYSLAKQFAANAKKETFGELLRCRELKWWKKLKIVLFYYFPILYRWYMAILKRFFWQL